MNERIRIINYMLKFIIQFLNRCSARLNLDILWCIIHKLPISDVRYLTWRLLAKEAAQLTFKRNGIVWTVQIQDAVISQSLFYVGNYHGQEIEKLLKWMNYQGRFTEKQNVIVDIGANIGTTCIPFAKQTDCQVFAIEPFPENFFLCQKNIFQNGLKDRITCVQKAISNRQGFVEMTMDIKNIGNVQINRSGSSVFDHSDAINRIAKNIPAEPLMDILKESRITADQIAFVWSDTEGCEGEVIQTGIPLWECGVPLYIEIQPHLLKKQNNLELLYELIPKYFDRFINSTDLVQRGEKAVVQPVMALTELIDHLIRNNSDTDVLLMPKV